jgi:hypothetical protein
MTANKLEFRTKCTTTTIEYNKCEPARDGNSNPSCGFACIKADRMYDRNILRIEKNRPVLAMSRETAEKMSNESLSWEYACCMAGPGAITIIVDFAGLEDYRRKEL